MTIIHYLLLRFLQLRVKFLNIRLERRDPRQGRLQLCLGLAELRLRRAQLLLHSRSRLMGALYPRALSAQLRRGRRCCGCRGLQLALALRLQLPHGCFHRVPGRKTG